MLFLGSGGGHVICEIESDRNSLRKFYDGVLFPIGWGSKGDRRQRGDAILGC